MASGLRVAWDTRKKSEKNYFLKVKIGDMILKMTSIFGWLANALVFIYKIPQFFKLYYNNDVSGFSVYSYLIQSISYSLYITHGFFQNDDTLAYGMIVPLIQNLCVILLYVYISKKPDTPATPT